MSQYAIGFIDILGQQDLLRNLTELPENPEENEKFLQTVKKTYGSILAMQNSFSNFYAGFSKHHIDSTLLTGKEKKLFRELRNNKIKFQNFSDCVVIYSSLRDIDCKFPIRSIYSMLGALASTSLTSLADGNPLRGGIDIGIAMEIKKNEIYGPALSRAYDLESKWANYPRIVIGNELVEYLKLHLKLDPNDSYSKVKIALAKLCLNVLATDYDGLTILDYLGNGFVHGTPPGYHDEITEKAYKKVLESLTFHRKNKNSKIATKYILLKNYFDIRKPEITDKIYKQYST